MYFRRERGDTMADRALENAQAAKLDELRAVLAGQEGAERLCPIEMTDINISRGALEKLPEAVGRLTPGKKVLMVSGPSFIVDCAGRDVKKRAYELLGAYYDVEWLVLSEPEGTLHATPENSRKIMDRMDGADCVVGVGSGTICDLCKHASYEKNREQPVPLVIVQTALSVNAFSDGVSVMLIKGVKRTVHSHYPAILIIDLDVVAKAPAEMNVSGYGDLIATWTAPVDWFLSYTLGMGDTFHTAPSDMIRSQCLRLLENSEKLKAGEPDTLAELANVLTLSGLSMGIAGESSPASGSEHVMSHLIDMASGVRQTGICYHGTQVAVSGIISSLVWDWFLHEFDPRTVDPDSCYPDFSEMEPKVRGAFDWLDNDHSAADECWSDFRKKLARWHEEKEKFKDFLRDFENFRAKVLPWVQKPEYLASCMHRAGAPCRYRELNYPVDESTAVWAVKNCHLMRSRFSIIDLLYFTGIWNDVFIKKIFMRAEALDAGL